MYFITQDGRELTHRLASTQLPFLAGYRIRLALINHHDFHYVDKHKVLGWLAECLLPRMEPNGQVILEVDEFVPTRVMSVDEVRTWLHYIPRVT